MTTESDHPPEPYRLDDQVGYLLRLAHQRHLSIFQQNMLDDLTPTQFSALIRLAEIGSCSQNDLGRRTSVDVATIKGVVDRLENKDLVAIRNNPDDRRQKIVSLTRQARKTIDQLEQAGLDISRTTMKPLTRAEQDQFLGLLRKLG